MAGFSNAEAQAILDARFPTTGATDHIAYSANGTSETASLARTAVGATGWAAATAADPSVKANAGTLTTAAASGAVVVSHFAVFTASTGGTQRTDWQALAASKSLAAGDSGQWAAGALQITLT
jgi:hypothetical protein